MEEKEKKEIKLRLSTVILLFIVFILIIALGIVYYLGFLKDKANTNNTLANVSEEKIADTNQAEKLTDEEAKKIEEEKNESKQNDGFLTEEEINQKLGIEDKRFIIESIDKDGNEYIVTAYFLDKEPRVITKSEYNNILNGGTIEFRHNKYKLDKSHKEDDTTFIKSGEKQLTLRQHDNNNKFYIDNNAGMSTDLSDTIGNKIKFKVKKDLIFDYIWAGEIETLDYNYNKSNNLQMVYTDRDNKKHYITSTTNKQYSIDALIKCINKTNLSGSYEEFNAYVEKGKVLVIINRHYAEVNY